MTERKRPGVRYVGTESLEGEQVEVFEAVGTWNGVKGEDYRKRWYLTHDSGRWVPKQYILEMKEKEEKYRLEDVRFNEAIDSKLFTVPENFTIVDK